MNQKLSKLQLLQRSIRQYSEQNNAVARELSFSLGPNALADAKKRLSELEEKLATACESIFRSCRVSIVAGAVVPVPEDVRDSLGHGSASHDLSSDADVTTNPRRVAVDSRPMAEVTEAIHIYVDHLSDE